MREDEIIYFDYLNRVKVRSSMCDLRGLETSATDGQNAPYVKLKSLHGDIHLLEVKGANELLHKVLEARPDLVSVREYLIGSGFVNK